MHKTYNDISQHIVTRKMSYRNVPLPDKLYEEVEKLVKERGTYTSVSEFVRETVRDRIEKLKVIIIRELPRKKARKEILEYLKTKDTVYPSEIADELRIDYHLVNEILRELWEQEKIEAGE